MSEMEAVTLRFNFEKDDIFRFNVYRIKNAKQFVRIRRLLTFIPPAIFLLLLPLISIPLGSLIDGGRGTFLLIFILVMTLVWLVIIPGQINKGWIAKTKKMLDDPGLSSVLFVEREMVFDREGVRISTVNVKESLNWVVFECAEELDDFFVLQVNKTAIHIVPKNKITQEQVAGVREHLKTYVRDFKTIKNK